MLPTIQSALKPLHKALTPIRLVAERLVDAESLFDPRTGVALLSRRPKIAPEAYACVLFSGVGPKAITRYEKLQRSIGNQLFEIPAIYRSVLLRLNGASLFDLSLCGLPPSMCQDPPLLDRSARQPLDLGTANQYWRTQYSKDKSLFHFGGAPHTFEENVAYFLQPNGRVVALLPREKHVADWPSIEEFLRAELPRVEAQYREYEDRMAAPEPALPRLRRPMKKKAPRR